MRGAETGDRGDKEASDGALQGQNPMRYVSSECGHTVNSNRGNGARARRCVCVCVCGLCARGGAMMRNKKEDGFHHHTVTRSANNKAQL